MLVLRNCWEHVATGSSGRLVSLEEREKVLFCVIVSEIPAGDVLASIRMKIAESATADLKLDPIVLLQIISEFFRRLSVGRDFENRILQISLLRLKRLCFLWL